VENNCLIFESVGADNLKGKIMDEPFLVVHDINIYKCSKGFYVDGFEDFCGTLQEAVDVACAKFCLDFIPTKEKVERLIGLEGVEDELNEVLEDKHLVN
jgi:hypothetical protein